jgi:hypothetical protein
MKEYSEWFDNWESVKSNFGKGVPDKEPNHVYAWYDDLYGYSGQAVVAYYKDRHFYLVTGSHCSCYGLEDQWEPEEYTPSLFKKMLEREKYSLYNTKPKLLELFEAAKG